jgi:hypothetical protein
MDIQNNILHICGDLTSQSVMTESQQIFPGATVEQSVPKHAFVFYNGGRALFFGPIVRRESGGLLFLLLIDEPGTTTLEN